jgi:hypothetical protein
MEPVPGPQSSTAVDNELRRRLKAYEARMHPNYDLRFNGRELVLRENGSPILNWAAVSGRPGKQSPEFQTQRGQGPLPEGDYQFNVSGLQKYDEISNWQKFKSALGGGEWKGGPDSWGRYRFWLTPAPGTETFARSDFSIHGGSTPGSAGCIDLTDEMDEFADLMTALGQDEINVKVDYGSAGSANHHRRR